jgi:hypothetical protein
MTPIDHLQSLAQVFNRALAELPAGQRQILADLAQPHVAELQRALTPPADKPSQDHA